MTRLACCLTILATILAAAEEPESFWEDDTIWIEDSANGALFLRFGVFGKHAEKSPGNLDRLPALNAWTPREKGRSAALVLKKAGDHLLIEGADRKTPVQAEDLSITARHDEDGGYLGRKPVLYARWQPPGENPSAAGLTLDVVPAAAAGEFKVHFHGQPLTGAKCRGLGPSGFTAVELVTDAQGSARFTPGPAGLYQVACTHVEPGPFFVLGKSYKGTRHRSTLTWRQP
jgi:hypothetical protein